MSAQGIIMQSSCSTWAYPVTLIHFYSQQKYLLYTVFHGVFHGVSQGGV